MHKTARTRRMGAQADARYLEMLDTLSEASLRRTFNPYVDIDWKSPEFAVRDDDPRWILPPSDPLGRHPWYLAQPRERQIAIGMWRQANVAKVGLQFENILIRGLMHYTFRLPNFSPEYRYCLHETLEECHHSMMFQDMVNRVGADVRGMPRYLRCLSPLIPLIARPMPSVFFFVVLAGEDPFDHLQRNILRDSKILYPLFERVMAIHVAEEARHISFAHQRLLRRVTRMFWWQRDLLSLYVPVIMWLMGRAVVKPPRAFWREFHIPRKVRKQVFFRSSVSREWFRDIFADIRLLAQDTGLMNAAARLMWWICRIDGDPSRYRGEPRRRPAPEASAERHADDLPQPGGVYLRQTRRRGRHRPAWKPPASLSLH